MKSIEFYDLPRPVQERFVAAAQASLAPAPLAVKPAPRYVGLGWFAASLLGFLVTAGFAAHGYGDLARASALASGFDAVLYCIGFTLSFACLTRGLTLRDRAVSLPFVRATYLFPMGVVDATSSALSVHSLTDLRTVEATADALQVTFIDGASFAFPARDQDQANAAKQAVTESQERLDEATRADSVRSLAALDPLCRTSFPSPFSQDIPYRRPTTVWAAVMLALAMVSGVVLGVGLWQVRNKLSARHLADSARALDTTEAYRAYLARGGRSPEIADTLLPRAELNEAKAAHSVQAIQSYIANHPGSKIQAEVDEALRSALLSALDLARTPGTLAALDDFVRAYPAHEPVAKELAEARHAVYRAAAERAKGLAVPTASRHADPAAFIDQLVDYVERRGPKVEIRFRAELGRSCKKADSFVRGSAYFARNSTLPTRYFGPEDMRRREALAAPLLLSALQSLFRREIVEFELGAALPSSDESGKPPPLPTPERPTLFISHRTELSGSVTNAKPRGIFFGTGMFFDTSFQIPGQAAALEISLKTWRSPSHRLMKAKERTIGDVYEDLARRSFSMFLRRYLSQVLRDPPQPALPHVELEDKDNDEPRDATEERDEKEG
jgi:hypothetical protein